MFLGYTGTLCFEVVSGVQVFEYVSDIVELREVLYVVIILS